MYVYVPDRIIWMQRWMQRLRRGSGLDLSQWDGGIWKSLGGVKDARNYQVDRKPAGRCKPRNLTYIRDKCYSRD